MAQRRSRRAERSGHGRYGAHAAPCRRNSGIAPDVGPLNRRRLVAALGVVPLVRRGLAVALGVVPLVRRGHCVAPASGSLLLRRLGVALLVALCWWAADGVNLDVQRIGRGLPAVANIVSLMIPDLRWLWPAIEAMGETLAIALIGTSAGALAAVPVALLAARNVAVFRIVAAVGRQISNAVRAFPELVLGMLFVASYGPGATAGALALGVHSVGMLSRLYADVIESVDPGPSEALVAAGACRLQVFRLAVLPQVLPEFVAVALYRFEINLRSANLLGLVGAGGIGVILHQALTLRRWGVVGACLLVIVAAVTAVDIAGAWLRKRLI